MAKKEQDLGRTDVGKQHGDMGKQADVGKQGGEMGKQGGLPGEKKKEWDKEKGGVGTPSEPGRSGGTLPTAGMPPA